MNNTFSSSMHLEDDRRVNKAVRALFKSGTDGRSLTDEAIEACYKQSIDPSELLNKQSEEFYDVDPKNGTTVE